ncbi:hypothetical protein Taro_002582 [Colocasia esculenta]|uniref:Uncharacterized protein n=1 Tax=Colocasia esculenta TaxID=4460 RepID=A0A843TL93_COLES|nr:hypothetical protein [Colocasia esculenta]
MARHEMLSRQSDLPRPSRDTPTNRDRNLGQFPTFTKNTQIGYGTTSPPLHATTSRRERDENSSEMPNHPEQPQQLLPWVEQSLGNSVRPNPF